MPSSGGPGCCARIMDCMCNRKLTKISLYCINTIILVGGIILTAVSSWGVRFDSNIRQGLPPSSIIPILIAGIFLMFLALFGTIGGCFNHSKLGRWFLILYAMMTLVVVLCEVIGASVALTALGKLSTPWTNSVTADTVDVWINATWFDCCFFPNDTARVTYDCWTAQHSSFVSNATCANEKAFYDEFTGWLSGHFTPAAAIALTFFLIQIIVIISAFCAFCHGRSKYRYFAAKGGNGGLELDEDHDPESAMDEITPRASKLEATVNHVSNRRTPSPGVDMQDIDVEAPAFTVANESDDSDNSPSNGISTRKSRRTRRPVARRGAGSDDEQEL